MRDLHDVDARHYSTFRLAAKFSTLWEVARVEELARLEFSKSPIVLGEGSNSIFLQNIERPLVRYLANDCQITFAEDEVLLHVDAGHNWHQLVSMTVENGWWGLENLALIPGSVGAAPVQNIGAYGVEFADCCLYVDFFEWESREVRRLTKSECLFGYRDSIFKQLLSGKGLIVAVGLQLARSGKPKLAYQGLDHLAADASIKAVYTAVIAVRQSKLPDPQQLANCGSFFKNPVVSHAIFQALKSQFPNIPGYKQSDGQVKLAAAWLLDQCGFKGARLGDIGCYEKQPLVLVNHAAGTGEQLSEFVGHLQATVLAKFEVMLEPEVRMYRE